MVVAASREEESLAAELAEDEEAVSPAHRSTQEPQSAAAADASAEAEVAASVWEAT